MTRSIAPMDILNDLVVLVADKNMEQAVAGVCVRPAAIGARPFTLRVFVHPGRDPGCLAEGVEFLRSFQRQFTHAVILFDHIGCGRESQPRELLEHKLEAALSRSGWDRRAAAIVIDPELEAWVWSDSPHVDRILGWQGREPSLRQWLRQEGWLAVAASKPSRPKEAMESALRTAKLARSSSLYRQLAQEVSLTRCTDPAFVKLRSTLQGWFGNAG